jgi:hypothetical protein
VNVRICNVIKAKAARHPFIAIVLAICAAYALIGLTPSSYSRVLDAIGVKDNGLLLGTPHQFRFDEYSIVTPLIQIAVNNGFKRINATSPYREDMRSFLSVPLLDWALPFKPQFWAFFILPAAAAYSIMHALLIGACLIGWYLLAVALRFDRLASSLFAVTVFALPHTQLWWATNSLPIVFFPWVLVAYLTPRSDIIRFWSVTYATATFLLAFTYEPVIAILAFGAVFVIAALRRDAFRPRCLLAGGAGALVGCGIVVLYLWDHIHVMMATVYPAERTLISGGVLPHTFVLAHLFPHFISDGWTPFYWNDLEVATGGSYALLFVLMLLDYHSLVARWRARDADARAVVSTVLILAAGAAFIIAWWLLPIPSTYAIPLQWNTTVPQRLAFTFGLLCHLMAFALVVTVGLVAVAWRFVATVAIIINAAIVSKFVLWHGHASSLFFDLFVLVPFAAIFFMQKWIPQFGLAVLGCAALSNLILFGSYNPVQLAGPIFAKHDTPTMRWMAELQQKNRNHWLVHTVIPGLVENGLGFSSITHVMLEPQLAFFRERFPDMPEPEFNYVFNRLAHVIVDPTIERPDLHPPPIVVRVPAKPFE